MRYLIILLFLYLAYKVANNLLEAVRSDGVPRRQVEQDQHRDLDIEEAKWEDIE